MIATWSITPVLGLAPLFHADPTVGGPPLLTPMGTGAETAITGSCSVGRLAYRLAHRLAYRLARRT